MDKALIFLMDLAYKSRIPLSFLITMCFLALDIRMQLEINVQTRRMRRPSFNNERPLRRQRSRSLHEESSEEDLSASSTSGSRETLDTDTDVNVSEMQASEEGLPGTSSGRMHRRQHQLTAEEEEFRDRGGAAVGINIHLDALRLSR